MIDPLAPLVTDLQQALQVHSEVLALVEAENQTLRQSESPVRFEGATLRRQVLPRLQASLERLRQQRAAWTRLTPAERAGYPQLTTLIRQCQDIIMRVLVLDRENEQALLRRGMLGPRHLPAHQTRRPEQVAGLYRRQEG